MKTIVFYNKILTFQKETKAKKEKKKDNTSLKTFTHSPPLFCLLKILKKICIDQIHELVISFLKIRFKED